MNADIFYILLSLCAILLCAIFISIILLLTRSKKGENTWELKLLQDQLIHMSKTLDYKLSENTQTLGKNMSETLKNSSHIADTSNKNIEAITKKLTELDETNKQIQHIGNRLEWLENVLKNPKRRWNLWEYFLHELLMQLSSYEIK